MNRWRLLVVLSAVVLMGAAVVLFRPVRKQSRIEEDLAESYPSDWFGAQRAWPQATIPQERYLGAAAGGVFKSTNAGVNWTPVFDRTGVFSIGAVALSPADSNTVYVGTGEANSSVDSYDGNGVYRTTDGGATWSSLGLAATARI